MRNVDQTKLEEIDLSITIKDTFSRQEKNVEKLRKNCAKLKDVFFYRIF